MKSSLRLAVACAVILLSLIVGHAQSFTLNRWAGHIKRPGVNADTWDNGDGANANSPPAYTNVSGLPSSPSGSVTIPLRGEGDYNIALYLDYDLGSRISEDDSGFVRNEDQLDPDQAWEIVQEVPDFSPVAAPTIMQFPDPPSLDDLRTGILANGTGALTNTNYEIALGNVAFGLGWQLALQSCESTVVEFVAGLPFEIDPPSVDIFYLGQANVASNEVFGYSLLTATCGAVEYDRSTQVCYCCGASGYTNATQQCCNNETGSVGDACCGDIGYFIQDVTTLCCNETFYMNATVNSMCCDTDIYETDSQACCDGEVRDEGTTCCGDTDAYFPDTEACCSGVKRTGGPVCCGDEAYDPLDNSKLCCNEVLNADVTAGSECCGPDGYDPTIEACCGTDVYDPTSQACCEGAVKSNGTACCGAVAYNGATQNCCNNATGAVGDACCGPVAYNEEIQKCCNSATGAVGNFCCGIVGYAETQKCCNSTTGAVGNACCDDKAYDPLDESIMCCDETLNEDATAGSKCCGTDVYDPTTEACCGGEVKANGTACCGTVAYNDASQRCCNSATGAIGDTCCGDKEYSLLDESKLCCDETLNEDATAGSKCCGTDVYDPTTEACCGGEVKANGTACCGTVAYNDSSQKCCNSVTGAIGDACCGDKAYDLLDDSKLCCDETLNEDATASSKCCGTDGYDPTTEACCGGEVKTNGTVCCGDKAYDPLDDSKLCCAESLNEDATAGSKCCGFDDYDPATEACCGGEVNANGTACCGTVAYNDASQKCCNTATGAIGGACCGDKTYDPSDDSKLCCEDSLNEDATASSACCGADVYDPTTEACCDREIKANGTACCGAVAYNDTTQKCCKSATGAVGDACCGDAAYTPGANVQCCLIDGDPGLFDPSEEACCGSTLGEVNETACCSGEPYNPSTHSCCGDNVKNVFEGPVCCGTMDAYDPLVDLCCGGFKVENGTVDALLCCSAEAYDPESEACCSGEKTNGGPECCGSDAYDPSTHSCCEEAIEVGTACCGNDGYNPTEQVCCGDLLITGDLACTVDENGPDLGVCSGEGGSGGTSQCFGNALTIEAIAENVGEKKTRHLKEQDSKTDTRSRPRGVRRAHEDNELRSLKKTNDTEVVNKNHKGPIITYGRDKATFGALLSQAGVVTSMSALLKDELEAGEVHVTLLINGSEFLNETNRIVFDVSSPRSQFLAFDPAPAVQAGDWIEFNIIDNIFDTVLPEGNSMLLSASVEQSD